jgi:hypothetical protein
VVIDRYLKFKRKSMIASEFVKFISLSYILRKSRELVEVNRANIIARRRGRFMGIIYASLWQNRSKKYGSDIKFKIKNHLRKNITMLSSVLHPYEEAKAKRIFKLFSQSIIDNDRIT